MWIASKYGFFSVTTTTESGSLEWQIRGRSKDDVLNLVKNGIKGKVVDTPDADYCSRLVVQKEDLTSFFELMEESITYHNFKNFIFTIPDQKEKLRYYHDIWGTMYDYQLTKTRPNVKKYDKIKR